METPGEASRAKKTERKRSRLGVLQTHDQGNMSGDEPEE
jgi:hypothetical protein